MTTPDLNDAREQMANVLGSLSEQQNEALASELLTTLDDATRFALVRLLLKPEERGDLIGSLRFFANNHRLTPGARNSLDDLLKHLSG